MPIQPGDKVTLSINPTVQLAEFHYVKPHASITRECGDDPEATLDEMQQDLHGMICRAMAAELGVLQDLYDALEEGKDALVDYCLANLNGATHESEGQTRSKRTTSGGKRKPRKPRKAQA